ncbi:hypothetical protein P8452_73111 [Trifolium repens]|nr:hypothetical protein P8452_73111 [Trifolium repens]
MLYTTVYDMCTQKPPRNYPRELYNMYKETCQEYIISKVLPSLREKNDDHLLRELLARWSSYQVMTRRLSKFFCYLERRDIPHYGLPSLEETSFISFYYLVYEEMDKEIMDAISAMIDRTRAGEQIDRSVALNTLNLYLELKECARKIKEKEEKMNRGPDVLSKKINLISSDGVVFEVDCRLALMSKRFEDIIETIPVGDVDIISVHEVDTKTLLDLQTSAKYLKIDRLNSLIWEKEFDLIKDMTPKEIVQFYSGIEDDSKLLEEKKE